VLFSFVLPCFTGLSSCSLAAKVSSIVEDASGYGPAVGILNSINSKLSGKKAPAGNFPAKTNHKKENRTGSVFLLLIQSLQACSDFRVILACIVLIMGLSIGTAAAGKQKKTVSALWIEDLSYYLRCMGIRTPKDSFLEVYRYNIGIGLGIKGIGVYQTLKKPAF
jgi:hypothetical protein